MITQRPATPWTADFDHLLRRHARALPAGGLIDPDASMTALGVDSLASLVMILEVEAAFSISIPDTMLTDEHFSTPMALWRLVSDLTAAGGGEGR
jgi:acyl carrier protein